MATSHVLFICLTRACANNSFYQLVTGKTLQKAFPLSGGEFSINWVTRINKTLIESHSTSNVSICKQNKLIIKAVILLSTPTCEIFRTAKLVSIIERNCSIQNTSK
jgi:hypothetical protein